MDIILSLVALFGVLTNALGVNDLARNTLAGIRDRAEDGYIRFRVWLAARIAGPLAWFMWICAAGMLGILGLATYIHVSIWRLGFSEGQYPLFFVTTVVSAFAISVWAALQRRWGRRQIVSTVVPLPPGHHGPVQQFATPTLIDNPEFQPRRVSFFMSGFLLTAGMTLVSVTLSFHALSVGSRGLWLTAMMTRYLGIVVIAAVMSVLAWFVRRGGGFFERALQFAVETVAPIVPGLTFQNVRERLFPRGLNLLEEEADAQRIAAVAMGIFMVVAPFDLILLIHPTNAVATYALFPYVATVLGGLLALRRQNLRARVEAAGDRFYWIVFKWIPLALLVVGAVTIFVTQTELGRSLWQRSEEGYKAVTEFVKPGEKKDDGNKKVPLALPTVFVVPQPSTEVTSITVGKPTPPAHVAKSAPAPQARQGSHRSRQPMSEGDALQRLQNRADRNGLTVPESD